ncbi:MAG TPA: hypothetical protein VGK58_18410 [Lacipirellulaceae bacterium]
MATSLASLWLPILVSGVVLFFASWLAWMVIGHHKADWKTLPNEDQVTAMIRGGIQPGQYMFPNCPTAEEYKSEAFKEKMKTGPHGVLYVWGPDVNMGFNMLLTWLLFTAISLVIAYLAGMVIPPKPNTDFWFVFRFVGTAGILVYATSGLLNAIWFRRRVIGDVIDGIAYGLITGLIFAAMWPGSGA